MFSFKRVCNDYVQQSRIDNILIARHLAINIQNVYYQETSFSDHDFMYLRCDFSQVQKGPGLWILNNTYLQDEKYVQKVKQIIENETKSDLYDSYVTIWWDNLKYKIKKYSQSYGKTLAKSKYQDYYRIQNELQHMSDKIASGFEIDISKYESLKLELKQLEENK